MTPRLVSAIGWATLTLWIASNVLEAWPGLNYKPNGSIPAVMAIVAGAAFTDRGIRSVAEMMRNGKTQEDRSA